VNNAYTVRYHLQSRLSVVAVAMTLFVAATTFTGCKLRLIGDYDETIDKGVTDFQQQAELYFAKLKANPNTAYDESVYSDLGARLAVLKTRASALPQYGIIAQQIANLKKQVDDMQELDKISSRPLPSIITGGAESGIDVSVASILKLELALKRGDAPSSSTAK